MRTWVEGRGEINLRWERKWNCKLYICKDELDKGKGRWDKGKGKLGKWKVRESKATEIT